MAKKVTSKEVASLASKILKGRFCAEVKSVAGSTLSQREKNKK